MVPMSHTLGRDRAPRRAPWGGAHRAPLPPENRPPAALGALRGPYLIPRPTRPLPAPPGVAWARFWRRAELLPVVFLRR